MHSTLNEEIMLENPRTATVIDRVFFAHLSLFETSRIISDTKKHSVVWKMLGTMDTNTVENNSNGSNHTPQE